MRLRLLTSAALTAGLAVAVAAGAIATTTARPAGAAAATTAATTTTRVGRPVFLVTGELITPGGAGASEVSLMTGGPAWDAGLAAPLQALSLGGQTYVVPLTAEPYLGGSLDPRLFQISALGKAEAGGRLPVRVRYSGAAPAPPGVTITSFGGGVAQGYLTAAGARTFGTALARQFAADHTTGRFSRNRLLQGGVSIALAGAPAAARQAAAPADTTHTLTVRGTNLAGQPDTGDIAMIVDADNSSLIRDDRAVFRNGIATFTVPAGHFLVFGLFTTFRGGQPFGVRLDILPEVTVTKNTTVQTTAAAANSKLQFLTARPATVYSEQFELDLLTGKAPHGCCSLGMTFYSIPGQGSGPIWVSPMPVAPKAGTLTQITTAQLNSPPKAPRTPYQYDVTYQSPEVVPAQRFAVNQATLATENSRFYSAIPQTGYMANISAFSHQLGSLAILPRTQYPLHLTMYLTAHPRLTWDTDYILWGRALDFVGGQISRDQVFIPGQRLTLNWGAYPLHPAAATKVNQVSGAFPIAPSASRTGDVLGLQVGTFGDNTPGHTPFAINAPFHATASYQLDQNGTKIAGGPLAHFHGYATIAAKLSPTRSLIKFVLNAAQPATLSPLSTASQTTWTWWSTHESSTTLPPGWVCTVGRTRSCAVQPLLTLRYGIVGMGINGSASPSEQVLRLSVGHLQLAKASPITSVAVSASFDGGKTWHPTRVTGSGTSYAAVFNAPAGAMVTLKTTATDAAGGSVTQTITNAYRAG